MAQTYYTLQEAAQVLGKTTEEVIRLKDKGELRAFADAGSWKFRADQIDQYKQTEELLGGLELGDADFDEDSLFDDEPAAPSSPLANDQAPATPSDSAVGRSLQGEAGGKGSGESDVRLIFSDRKDGSDSDVSLIPDFDADEPGDDVKPPSDSDIRFLLEDDEAEVAEPQPSAAPTEEFKLADPAMTAPADLPTPTPSPVAPPASDSGLIPLASMDEDESDDLFGSDDDLVLEPAPRAAGPSDATVEDSALFDDDLGIGLKNEDDIDLNDLDLGDIQIADKTPTVKQAAGDDDSDSDFDLNLDDDIGLAQDITPGAGDSGINLGKPDDSGILLKKAVDSGVKLRSDDTDSSDSEFDVSLESDDDIFDSEDIPTFKASDTAPRLAKPDEDSSDEISDSDFELALDSDGDEESGSDVVALDDDDEDEDESSDELDEDEEVDVEDAEPVMVNAEPAPWGGLWVGFLGVTTMIFVVVMMMMYEISRNAWSYHEPYTLTATIINGVYDTGKSMGVLP